MVATLASNASWLASRSSITDMSRKTTPGRSTWEKRRQMRESNHVSLRGVYLYIDKMSKHFQIWCSCPNLGHHQAFVSPLCVPSPLLLSVKWDLHFWNNCGTRLVTALRVGPFITQRRGGLSRFRPCRELRLKMGHKFSSLYARLGELSFFKRSNLRDKWLNSDYRQFLKH